MSEQKKDCVERIGRRRRGIEFDGYVVGKNGREFWDANSFAHRELTRRMQEEGARLEKAARGLLYSSLDSR